MQCREMCHLVTSHQGSTMPLTHAVMCFISIVQTIFTRTFLQPFISTQLLCSGI